MGVGRLKVSVHTGEDALPIENADVLIKDKKGDVLYNLKTDESGNTDTVELYAPERIHTLNPNDPGPYYATYDVSVSHAREYATSVINDVQIFDGISSTLPVNLLPSPGIEGDFVSLYYVEPGELHSEPIRQQVGDDPVSAVNPAVLREVFIPDFITVHLGRPDQYGRNVRVKFTDYIKNVASSEIYPTWPTNALIANIYAIITFALNRVYTEWYRSRRYDFDITNSTAYDMAFSEGRNIFDNISVIVDNIFNQYVRRIGRREPFFTSFCNGTTAQCRGLSQWGTVTLANQGLNPLQILRYYYPRDIEIVETNNIAGITSTYPGTAQREGMTSEAVRRMQNYLNRIRANYPAIPVISNPNGFFGPDTTAAVREFQRIFGMTRDGIIGKDTWYKIINIYVGVTKLAELESEGERIGIGLAPPTSVLRLGSKGADVIELQFILNFISMFYPTVPSVIQDGTYRETTRDAVINFQRTFGLLQDGIVGPRTWEMLYQIYRRIENTIQPTPPVTPPTTPPVYPGVFLRVGSRGSNVLFMQQSLNKIGETYTAIPRLSTDGVFGPETERAVIAFQRIFNLTPDGIIGPLTWNAIVREATS